MNWKTVFSIFVLLGVLGLTIWAHKVHDEDQQMRQLYGRVTPVSVLNWSGEVEDYKDQMPVLIFFHTPGHFDEQRTIVKDYAWLHAKKVKVVSVDLDRPENLLFAARFGVLRHPAFVVIYKDKVVHGYAGTISDAAELKRLVEQALDNR